MAGAPRLKGSRPSPGLRDPKKREAAQGAVVVADNIEVFDTEGACRFLNVTADTLDKAVERTFVAPAKLDGRNYYTRRDLVRFQRATRKELRVALVMELLRAGEHPIDVYIRLQPHGVSLDDVMRTMRTWAKLSGIWLVEAPPGSYARWLERLGRVRVTPRDIRRCIEAMLAPRATEESWRAILRPLAPSEAPAPAAQSEPPPSSEEPPLPSAAQ